MAESKFLNKIILVDDDPAFHLIAKKNLKKIEVYQPLQSFYTGKEFLQSILEQKDEARPNFSNLVLLDINMPEMNGWEFLEAFSQLDHALQLGYYIVILTSSISLEERNRGLSYPMVKGYYHKPMNKNGIRGILDDYMAKVNPEI
ncbi:response regulator [Algoriphagus sp.]|uniref:response regulator n=1 Tax=Algoriphagus sp. TaxID=1872435 RepID=UPI002624E725|nr:response regulator [Algoriphagus sp.]